MKHNSGMFKRIVAMVLAVIMVLSCSNGIGHLHAHAEGEEKVTLGSLIVSNDDEKLTEVEKVIITSGVLSADKEYTYILPPVEVADGGLIAVDEENETVTASVYTDDEGNLWVPVSFDVTYGGNVVGENDDIALTEDGGVYTGQYENAGNTFSIEVTYSLDLTVPADEQQALLDAGKKLAADVEVLKQLDAVDIFTSELDDLTDDQKALLTKIKNMLYQEFPDGVTAEVAMLYLVMNVLEDQNGNPASAIDLIYMMKNGIEINDEYSIGLSGTANKNAAQNLYDQKEANKALALYYLLNTTYADLSYLELLALHGAELQAALASNYEDLLRLATNANALPGISGDLEVMLEDTWILITETAEEYGYTVTNLTQLEKALKDAKDMRQEKLGELNSLLQAEGYTGTVEDADDIDDAIKFINDKKDEALSELNQKLQDAGYEGTVTGSNDIGAAFDFLEKTKNDALAELNTALTEAGYTGTVTGSSDIGAAFDFLEKTKNDALTELNAQLSDAGYTGTVTGSSDIGAAFDFLEKTKNDALAELNAQLSDAGYTGTVTGSGDIAAAFDFLEKEKNEALAELNDQLSDAGYTGTVTGSSDIGAAFDFLEKTKNDALTELNAQLSDAGYTGTVTGSGDIAAAFDFLEQEKEDALAELNDQLNDAGYTGTVTGSSDIAAAFDFLEQEKENALAELNDQLSDAGYTGTVTGSANIGDAYDFLEQKKNDALAELNAKLSGAGYSEKVEKAADIDDAIDYLKNRYDQVIKTANDAIKAEFPSAGEVKSAADVTNLIPSLESANRFGMVSDETLENARKAETALLAIEEAIPALEAAKPVLQKLEDVLAGETATTENLKTLEDVLKNEGTYTENLKKIEDVLKDEGTYTENLKKIEDVLKDEGTYTANLKKIEDVLKDKATYTENLKKIEDVLKDKATYTENLKDLEDVLKDKDNLISMLKQAEDALEMETEATDMLKQAEEAVELLGEAKTTLAEADELIAMMEEAKVSLAYAEEMKDSLDMLILMIRLLCKTLQPVYDAFDDNTWNTPSVLDTTKNIDYEQLTEYVDGLAATKATVKDSLHVTTSVVKYNMSMFNVTVKVQAQIVDPAKVDSTETVSLSTYTAPVVTLRKDATAEEIQAAIDELKADNAALAQADWVDVISTDNYDRLVSEIPETLTKDLTYTITYVPKMIGITYGEGFAAGHGLPTEVPYGYQLTLPVYDGAEENTEYVYTVNGKANQDQDIVVTIKEATEISRVTGQASAKKSINELVVKTNELDAIIQAILLSEALKQTGSLSIVVPTEEQLTVEFNQETLLVDITAESLFSRIPGLYWNGIRGDLDGANGFEMVDGKHSTGIGFDKTNVYFELALTAAALNLTDAELLEVMNTPHDLAVDYENQKAVLDALLAQKSNLMMLSTSKVIENSALPGGSANVKEILGLIPNFQTMYGLADSTVAAATELGKLIPETGYLPIVNTLNNYESEGMLNFYKNETTYLAQINQLYGFLDALVTDDALMGLLDSFGFAATFTAANTALSNAYKLNNEYAIDDKIIVSSPALPALLNNLAVAVTTEYTKVPANMIWTEVVSMSSPGKATVNLSVSFNGINANDSWTVPTGSAMDMADLEDRIAALKAQVGMTSEVEKYYTEVRSEIPELIGGTVNITVTWKENVYEVYVDGQKLGTVTVNGGTVTLPEHETEGYVYTYYIGGNEYASGDFTFTGAMVKDLLVNDQITITRTEKNVAEDKLIKTVDGMGAVLTKDANGEYTVVLKVEGEDPMAAVMETLMGLYLSGYEEVQLGGYTFVAGGQIHIQALIDMILFSGMGTESFKALVDNNGNFVNLVLAADQIISNYEIPVGAVNVAMGGELIESTIGFDNTIAKLYITLDETSALGLREKAIEAEEEKNISFICEEGAVKLTAELNDDYYALYAAALTMVEQADLKYINEITGEIAFGYIFNLLDPILKDANVDGTTIENTLGKVGVGIDMDTVLFMGMTYGDLYTAVASQFDAEKFEYADNSCLFALEGVSINGLIDSMAGKIELPEQLGDISLGSLIYEYKDNDEDTDAGLDIRVGAALTNMDKEYVALAVNATDKSVTMVTIEELAALTNAQYVLLLADLGDEQNSVSLTLDAKVLDLNGKYVWGDIAGTNNLRIVDNAFKDDEPSYGTVIGTVTGATIIGGVYVNDVTNLLPEGYAQDEDGKVYNKLYTLSGSGNDIKVTLNANDAIKSLVSLESGKNLALDLVIDLVMNYYSKAALTIGGYQIYDVEMDDLLSLLDETEQMNALIDEVLSYISAPQLAELVNDLTAKLTAFEDLEAALNGDGVIFTYNMETAAWVVNAKSVNNGEYVTIGLDASETKESGTLTIAISGEGDGEDMTDEMAALAGALADTTVVESTLTLEDIVREGNAIVVKGEHQGSVVIDFSSNPDYVVMMAVIIAHGNKAVRADLVEAIKAFEATGWTNPADIKKVVDKLTVSQIITALEKTGRNEAFTTMVSDLGLTGIVSEDIKDDAMGFDLAIDALAFLLRRYSDKITVNGAFGGAELEGEYGVYGFSPEREFNGNIGNILGYTLEYALGLNEVLEVSLFVPHEHTMTETPADPATCTEDGTLGYFTCDVCHKVFEDAEGTKETTVEDRIDEATDHSFTNYVSNGDATCQADGTETAVCDNGCGETDTRDDEGSKLDHSFTNYVSNGDATCTTDGTETALCDYNCGTKDTRTDAGSALGHDFDAIFDWDAFLAGGTNGKVAATIYCKADACDAGTTLLGDVVSTPGNAKITHTSTVTYHDDFSNTDIPFTDSKIQYLIPEVTDDPIVDDSTDESEDVFGWVVEGVEDALGDVVIEGTDDMNGVLTLDKAWDGMTVEELRTALTADVKNDSDGVAEFHFYDNVDEYSRGNAHDDGVKVINGAVVEVIARNGENGELTATRTYLIIVLGDTSCNGGIDSGDSVKIMRHVQGIKLLTGVELLAADTNRNGRIDAGDAVRNAVKVQNRNNNNYETILPEMN